MKKTFSILLLWLAFGHAMSQNVSTQTTDNFKKLKWIEGTWRRTDSKDGQSGHERWLKSTPHELRGYGVTMKGQDTLFVEKLRILIKEDNLYYVADVPENQNVVYFKLTEITNSGFVCENPDHDFPKRIAYQAENNKLKASISGNGKSMDFHFEKE